MIGMITSEHVTWVEQPSDALDSAVEITKRAEPLPSRCVAASVVLLGCSCPSYVTASGAMPAQPTGPPPYTVPSAARNGIQCWTPPLKIEQPLGTGEGTPTWTFRSAGVAL